MNSRIIYLCTKSILGCYKITTVFSHVQDKVRCVGCQTILCRPTGGKGKLSDGRYIRILFNI